MTTERLSIVIDYLLDSGEERAVRLTPEEYFDLDENDDVAHLGVDFTPKHQEVRRYLPENTRLKQSRVRISDTSSGDVWEVSESYWSQSGDDCICVTVREIRNGTELGWRKFVHIRSSDGRERVLTFTLGENFPVVDSYVVVENDELQGIVKPEQSGLFRLGTNSVSEMDK